MNLAHTCSIAVIPFVNVCHISRQKRNGKEMYIVVMKNTALDEDGDFINAIWLREEQFNAFMYEYNNYLRQKKYEFSTQKTS